MRGHPLMPDSYIVQQKQRNELRVILKSFTITELLSLTQWERDFINSIINSRYDISLKQASIIDRVMGKVNVMRLKHLGVSRSDLQN